MPSPTCTVNGVATPVDVSASAEITIALANTSGAIFWSISCSSTDEQNTAAAVNATLVVNSATKTATCSVSALLGSAYIFTSVVGVQGPGLDNNGSPQPSYTTTFKVNVKTSNGFRVLATNESAEQSSTAGWIEVVNAAIRALP